MKLMMVVLAAALVLPGAALAAGKKSTPKPTPKPKPAATAAAASNSGKPNCTPSCYPDEPAAKGPTPCGANDLACEPAGSKTARAANMVHYRLDEAKKAQAAGKKDVCAKASWVAAALATGLPKFRDGLKASGSWSQGVTYKTRSDGTLDEDKLFAKVSQELGDAKKLYAACAGAVPPPKFTDDDLYAFKVGAKESVDTSSGSDEGGGGDESAGGDESGGSTESSGGGHFPAELENADDQEYQYELDCGGGGSNHSSINGSTTTQIDSDCTLKIGGSEVKVPSGGKCTIKDGAVSCSG